MRALEPEANPVAGLRDRTGCFEVELPEPAASVPAGRDSGKESPTFIAHYDRRRSRLVGEPVGGQGAERTGPQKIVSLGLDETAREWVEAWMEIWDLKRQVEWEERTIREDAAPSSLALILCSYYLQEARVSYVREATGDESPKYVYPVRPDHPVFFTDAASDPESDCTGSFEVPSLTYSPTARRLADSELTSETGAAERRLEEATYGVSRVIPISEGEREQIREELRTGLARRNRIRCAREGDRPEQWR